VTALNNQLMGDPLLLECNVTTVRGITSSVDIVWIINDKEVERVYNVSGETIDKSVVYSNTYSNNGSFLSKDDNGTVYRCFVSTAVNTTGNHTLNLKGDGCINSELYTYDILFNHSLQKYHF